MAEAPEKKALSAAAAVVRNPLSVIAMFVLLVEAIATITLINISRPQNIASLPLVWFVVLFPTLVALLFFGTLWWRHQFLYSPMEFRRDESFLIAMRRVEEKMNKVEQDVDITKSDIEAIRIALRAILMKHEFGPLKALDEAGRADISKGHNLVAYLHRLDGLKFVQPNPGHGLNEIERIRDGETFNLKDYLHITNDGKAYLDITTKLKILKSGVDWKDPYPWTPLPPS